MPVVSALTSLISLFSPFVVLADSSSLQQCHSREEIICVTNALGFRNRKKILYVFTDV